MPCSFKTVRTQPDGETEISTQEEAQRCADIIAKAWGRMPGEIVALCERADEQFPATKPHRTILCTWPSWKDAQEAAAMIDKESTRPSMKSSTIDLLKAYAFCPVPAYIETFRSADPRFTQIALAGSFPSGEKSFSVGIEVVWNLLERDVGFNGINLKPTRQEMMADPIMWLAAALYCSPDLPTKEDAKASLAEIRAPAACLACGSMTTTRCESCCKAAYCSTACQRAQWRQHKGVECKAGKQLFAFYQTLAVDSKNETQDQRRSRLKTSLDFLAMGMQLQEDLSHVMP